MASWFPILPPFSYRETLEDVFHLPLFWITGSDLDGRGRPKKLRLKREFISEILGKRGATYGEKGV